MLKIRRSDDRLIFNMRIPGKDSLYIETGPWFRINGLFKSLFGLTTKETPKIRLVGGVGGYEQHEQITPYQIIYLGFNQFVCF